MNAEVLRAAIIESGGLATLADLARRWGVTKQRVHALKRHPAFPRPIYQEGRMALYLVCEADKFRATVRPPGRPPKR